MPRRPTPRADRVPLSRTPPEEGQPRPRAGLSSSNPALQELRRLSRRRSARSDSGTFLIDGPVLLAEAISAGVELRTVFVEHAGVDLPAVSAARAAGVDVREVQDGALARVLDLATPQSVVSVAAAAPRSVDDVLSAALDRGRPVLVLVEVQDPGNAGTLVRVAEASGCAGVVLTARSVDLHNPKTVRATAGAMFRLPIAEGADPVQVVAAGAAVGMTSWATVRDGGTSLDDVDLSGPCLLLVGSEAHGLPDDVRRAAGAALSIPMDGAVESLNAAVAGALVAFEAARQRRRSVAGAGDGHGSAAGGAEPVAPVELSLGHDVSASATGGGGTRQEERST